MTEDVWLSQSSDPADLIKAAGCGGFGVSDVRRDGCGSKVRMGSFFGISTIDCIVYSRFLPAFEVLTG